MLAYNMRLAVKSFRRNPGLTALMVGAIAVGIAACVVTMTVYHAMSGNPIWWKSERLYAVTIDNWDPNRAFDLRRPQLPPPLLSYRDALRIGQSNIPLRHVVMHKDMGVVTGGTARSRPESVITRVTTADFFAMFDVPFLYGGAWSAAADRGPDPVIVLSKRENETLFGGINSVGRTIRWNDIEFRIVGVLDQWAPRPKFYDLNNGSFDAPEDAYVPLLWTEILRRPPKAGNHSCWRAEIPEPGDALSNSFLAYLNADTCVWLQLWVELPDARSRQRMQAFLDAYWAQQHQQGRFPRPRDNRLTNVSQWLVDQQVVGNDDRMLVGLASAFLAVCLINTIGLLLAKFLNGAALTGVRRALGASRRQIFAQHMVETGLLAAAGALLGLLLGALGLWGLRTLYSILAQFGDTGHQELARFDMASVVIAVGLAAVAAFAAGLYPAWRVGRLPPAVYLKSQ
jgi:putative ABC transport system permease protein